MIAMRKHDTLLVSLWIAALLALCVALGTVLPDSAEAAPYSVDTYTGNGTQTSYAVTFPYIQQADVTVTVGGIATTAFTWPSSSQINFTTAPAAGATIVIARHTTLSGPDVIFQPGSLASKDLNTENLQLLYLDQEQQDALSTFAIGAIGYTPANAAQYAAPVNLASNTQWEIMSGSAVGGTKYNIEGTGTMAPISCTANTTPSSFGTTWTGSYDVTFSGCGSTGELKVGDLVLVSGTGVDTALIQAPMRVNAMVANSSITVIPPYGLKPTTSQAATLTPVNVGVLSSNSTGDAADGGWKKTTTLYNWREDNAVNLCAGATYAMGLHKDVGTQEALWMVPGYQGSLQAGDMTRYRGLTVAFGMWVYHKVNTGGGTFQVGIYSNGTGGSLVTSASGLAGSCQWIEVSYLVPPDATVLTPQLLLNGAAGDTYYVSDPVFTVGSYIGGRYTKRQEIITPVVHITPESAVYCAGTGGVYCGWQNLSLTFSNNVAPAFNSFTFDLYAETWGEVAPTVLYAQAQLEGVDGTTPTTNLGSCCAANTIRVWGFYNKYAAPEISGGFLNYSVAGIKAYTGAVAIPFDGTGHALVNDGTTGDAWYNVSMELDWFLIQ